MKPFLNYPVRFLHRHGAEIVSVLTIVSLVASSLPYAATSVSAATFTKTWNASNTSNFASNPTGYLSSATSTVEDGIDGSGGTIAMEAPAVETVSEDFSGTPGTDYHTDAISDTADLNGLVLLQTMDAVDGTTAYDSSSQAGTATFNGTTTQVPGRLGMATDFDGTGNLISDAANSGLASLTQATVTGWVYLNSDYSTSDGIFTSLSNDTGGNGPYAGGGMALTLDGWDGTSQLRFVVDTSGSNSLGALVTKSGTRLSTGRWYYVTVTWDGSTSYTGVKFYINGALDSTSFIQDSSGSYVASKGNYKIGSLTTSHDFHGSLDDFRVYNRVLSSSEISQLYSQTVDTTAPVSSGDLSTVTQYVALTSTTTSTYTVPFDWNSNDNQIEVIGAGGGAPQSIDVWNGPGTPTGGGGGGGYANSSNVSLTAGATVGIKVGAGVAGGNGGDTYFCSSSSNCASVNGSAVVAGASGGKASSNQQPQGGAGGAAVVGTGYSGGAGGNGSAYSCAAGHVCTGSNDAAGGGGGAGGPHGAGAQGGDANDSYQGGPGGGGGGGGSAGSDSTSTSGSHGATGGNNYAGSGGGAGGAFDSTFIAGSAGVDGAGGGGGGYDTYGGAGGDGIDIGDGTVGSGGGGGGHGTSCDDGGTRIGTASGGLYGGGAGGNPMWDRCGGSSAMPAVAGGDGLINLTYTRGTAVSTSVASSTTGGIAQARISNAVSSTGTGSITYYLSNDGGTTWTSATPGSYVTFATTGNDLRYKIVLTGNATVTSFDVDYKGVYTTATLMNLKLDGAGGATDAQWVALSWDANMPANTSVQFRTRGVTNAEGLDSLYSATWSATTTATTTGVSGAAITGNLPGGGATPAYRYLEIEVILNSTDGVAKPTVTSVTATYAINGAPDFESDYPAAGDSGAGAYQNATSSDSTWGKVAIDYAVRDSDATSGSTNPGCIEPSFEYSLDNGSTWNDIPSGDLSLTTGTGSCAAGLQPVSEGSYTAYTAYWNATSTTANQYTTTAKVRVTANDHEAVNSIGTTTTAAFTLDTTAPTATLAINGESSTSTITASLSDDTTLQDYLLSNNSDYSADGDNADSGTWQDTSGSSQTLNIPWTMSGSNANTVYFEARDTSGNLYTGSVVAPATASTTELDDVSNPGNGTYQLFYSWAEFTSAAGATFDHYDVWRSTDGSTYTHLTNVSNSSQNYYFDQSLASSTTYYYKERTVDTDGDMSAFTDPVHVMPGTGGSSRAPTISDVQIPAANVKTSSAQVTWTTDTLSNSEVDYSDHAGVFTTEASSSAYGTSHSVYITGLTPGVTYYLQVKSTSPSGGSSTDNNGGNGYSFTTGSGPVISNVSASSITNSGATITWNTDTDSDSYVIYGTDSSLTSTSTAGTASLVGTTTSPGVYTHTVDLSGLSTATTYYFYVTSKDSSDNTTTDNNLGSNYSFKTTQDTTPPTISDISEPVLSSDTAVVVWTTDEPATSQLEYGTTASTTHGSYASETTEDSTLNLTHVATLSSLTATTNYYFRAISADAAGNQTVSDEDTFATSDTGTTIIIIKRTGSGANGDTKSETPVISKVTVDPINALDATVHVSVAPASQVVVSYGPTSSSSPSSTFEYTAGNPDFDTDSTVKLQNLQPGTMYHFVVDAVSDSGKRARSEENTFTTKYLAEDLGNLSTIDKINEVQDKLKNIIESALPSINPPFITNPKVSDITTDSATVSWDTNIGSYSVLDYSTADEFAATSTYAHEQSDLTNATTGHSITLTNLESGTSYHYKAKSFYFPQAVGASDDLTFATKAPAILPQLLDVKTDSFRLIWKTNSPASSVVQYTDKQTGATNTHSDNALSTSHDVTIENLTPGDTYEVLVSGVDGNGTNITAEKPITVTTSLDTIPPTITALKIDSTLVPGRSNIIQSVVSWKTDKPASSVVLYDEGSGSVNEPLRNKIQDTSSYVQNHVMVLPDLKPATIYRIQIASTDQAGNTTTLPTRTIVTPQQAESIVDIIFKNFGATFPFLNGQ